MTDDQAGLNRYIGFEAMKAAPGLKSLQDKDDERKRMDGRTRKILTIGWHPEASKDSSSALTIIEKDKTPVKKIPPADQIIDFTADNNEDPPAPSSSRVKREATSPIRSIESRTATPTPSPSDRRGPAKTPTSQRKRDREDTASSAGTLYRGATAATTAFNDGKQVNRKRSTKDHFEGSLRKKAATGTGPSAAGGGFVAPLAPGDHPDGWKQPAHGEEFDPVDLVTALNTVWALVPRQQLVIERPELANVKLDTLFTTWSLFLQWANKKRPMGRPPGWTVQDQAPAASNQASNSKKRRRQPSIEIDDDDNDVFMA